MIDANILKEIKMTLENLIRSFQEKNFNQHTNYIISNYGNNQSSQFSEILSLSQTLIYNLRPRFEHRTLEDKLEATNYLKSHRKNDEHYDYYLSINSEYNYEQAVKKLYTIQLINEPISDKLQLAILTQFFDDLAHLQNTLATKSYKMKDILIKHFLEKYPNDTFAVTTHNRQNADIAFFLYTNERFLSWHSKDTTILTSDFPEPFYIMAKKALSTLKENKGKNFTKQEVKTAFLSQQFSDERMKDILELDNIKTINQLVYEEKEKANSRNQPSQNDTTQNDTKTNKEPHQKKQKVGNDTKPTTEVDKLIDYLEVIECSNSIEDLSTYIKEINWEEFRDLSQEFSVLSRSTKNSESIERIVTLACIIDNLIDSYSGLKDTLGKYCYELCSKIIKKGIIVVPKSKKSDRYFVLNPSLNGDVSFNDNNPKIKINLHSNVSIPYSYTIERDGRKKIQSLPFSEIVSYFFEDTKDHKEFVGGGTYEEETLDTSDKPVIDTSVKSDNSNDTPVCRDTQKLWEAITASNNDTIQKLLSLSTTGKVHNGFNISEIAKMEILQTSFNNGIISSSEFESQQLEILSSIISNSSKKNRIEIKFCGETNKKKDNLNRGKFLVIRIQNALAGKPIFYKLSNEMAKILQEKYPNIQLTSGKAVHSINNLGVLEKISSKNTPEHSKANEEMSESTIEHTEANKGLYENIIEPAEINEEIPENTIKHIGSQYTPTQLLTIKGLDDFLNEENSMEILRSAMKNASPETKVYLATIIELLLPGHMSQIKRENTHRRNGGPVHE